MSEAEDAAPSCKVGFRSAVSLIAVEENEKTRPTFTVEHKQIGENEDISETLKAPQFIRSKQRKCTGYPPKEKQKESDENEESSIRTIVQPQGVSKTWCCGMCGNVDAEETSFDQTELLRRESSVGIGHVVEIEDPAADKNWHDEPRHEDRWKRIRKRVPTGNPKLMKASSEELIEIREEEIDPELVQNTEANQKI